MDKHNVGDEDTASISLHKDKILNLDDSEESFVILDKVVVKSVRSSSPSSDEGVSDCDCTDQQSSFPSQSHDNTDNVLHKLLLKNKTWRKYRFEKIEMYQKQVLSAMHEITEKLDLLKLTNSVDYSSVDSPNKVVTTTQTTAAETAQDSSLESVDTTQTPPTETQCVISTETEPSATVNVVHTTVAETQCVETLISYLPIEQSIMFIEECDKIIEKVQSKTSRILIDSSLTEEDLAECGRKLSEYRNRLRREKNEFTDQWQAFLNRAKLEVPMTDQWQTLAQESEKLTIKMLEKEVSLLRENCRDLTKKVEDAEVENDALRVERNEFKLSSKLSEDELRSSRELIRALDMARYKSLGKENSFLKSRSDEIQVDLENVNAVLADASFLISELQEENADLQDLEDLQDLQEADNAVDIYKDPNEKQKMEILRLRATEKCNLRRIELLTDENNILQCYINKLLIKISDV